MADEMKTPASNMRDAIFNGLKLNEAQRLTIKTMLDNAYEENQRLREKLKEAESVIIGAESCLGNIKHYRVTEGFEERIKDTVKYLKDWRRASLDGEGK